MALSTNTVWEVRSGGSDINGGGFVTGASGSDFSQQTSPQATLTVNSVVNSTTTIIDVDAGDYTCTDDDVGNTLHIHADGSATEGWYRITARSSQQWTLDRSAGTAGQTLTSSRMGGALATPGALSGIFKESNIAWVQGGTPYTLSSSTAGPGGPIAFGNEEGSVKCYTTTRGDGGTAEINAGAQTSIDLITGNFSHFFNFIADGNSQTGVTGFSNSTRYNCVAHDCVTGFTNGNAILCESYSNSDSGFSSAGTYFCVAHDNDSQGFEDCGESISSIAYDNGGHGFYNNSSSSCIWSNVVAYNNTDDGFRNHSSNPQRKVYVLNGVSVANGGYGAFENGGDNMLLSNVATYNNTSGRKNADLRLGDIDPIVLTADPFVDAANDDFRPNDTSGGGAELRGAGIGVSGQTNSQDVGAVQHADPSGGGGMKLAGRGGLAG